jgi:hypothetical protein
MATMRSPRVSTPIPGAAGAPGASISVRFSNRMGGVCAAPPMPAARRARSFEDGTQKMSDKSVYNWRTFPPPPTTLQWPTFRSSANGTERAVACPPGLNNVVRPSHQSRFEKVAAASLGYKGYAPYLPCYLWPRCGSDPVTEIEAPLFPGYGLTPGLGHLH